jgi:hypothetical protein
MLADSIPHNRARFPSNTSCRVALFQKGDGVVEPQQLDERARISLRVLAPGSNGLESGYVLAWLDAENTPPTGDDLKNIGEMASAYDDRRSVENLAVQTDLTVEAAQAVSIGLDFKAVQ